MIDKTLTLSIVIPVYNEQCHLKACLDAIANQTESPDEVIVVDNNSTDRTLAIAESYPFVKILKEKKQGVLAVRTKGFNSARSSIIGRIDADTVLPPGWVILCAAQSITGRLKVPFCLARTWLLKGASGHR
jgi:glycosyltransferase involved in cell wall biosynthesis